MATKNSDIDASTTVKASAEQVSSNVADEEVILNLKNGSYYGLDPIGAEIWKIIQEPTSVDEVVAELTQRYDVEKERCTQDVLDLLRDMNEHELLEVNSTA